MPRPTAILVTGVPGSGKTTLARELSTHLRVPHLARDDVRTGLYFTAGAWTEAPGPVPTVEASVATFLDLAEHVLAAGVSCVLEYLVRRDRPQDLDRLTAVADVVVVRTRCEGALDRFAARNRADRLIARPAVLAALGFGSIEEHTAAAIVRMQQAAEEMQDRFDVPAIDVDTTDGYHPSIDEVVRFVTGAYQAGP